MVSSKEEFYLGMDLQDLGSAGAFIDKEVWDKFILKPSDNITIKPRDYTK